MRKVVNFGNLILGIHRVLCYYHRIGEVSGNIFSSDEVFFLVIVIILIGFIA